MKQNRPLGLTIIAGLMIAFGLLIIFTALTHRSFGGHASHGALATYAGAAVGVLYALAGLLTIGLKQRAASWAIAVLVVIVISRIVMMATGLEAVDSPRKLAAVAIGTVIAAGFAIYIARNRSAFS